VKPYLQHALISKVEEDTARPCSPLSVIAFIPYILRPVPRPLRASLSWRDF